MSASKSKTIDMMDEDTAEEEGKDIYGGNYSAETIDMNEGIVIGCPQHGDFICTPQEHLDGYGCPDCKNNDTLETLTALHKRVENFINTLEGSDENKVKQPNVWLFLYEVSDKIKNMIGGENGIQSFSRKTKDDA